MTDLAVVSTAVALDRAKPARATPSRRMILLAVVAVSITAAVMFENAYASNLSADRDLALLLRFMAVIKAAMALGAVALAVWRLGFAASLPLTVVYMLAAALMAAAPVPIWTLAHVAAGALLFHIGFVLWLGAAWIDRADVAAVAGDVWRMRRS